MSKQPNAHIFTTSKANGEEIVDSLSQYEPYKPHKHPLQRERVSNRVITAYFLLLSL